MAGEKEQEKFVGFKGGSSSEDKHRSNTDTLSKSLWYHTVSPQVQLFAIFILLRKKFMKSWAYYPYTVCVAGFFFGEFPHSKSFKCNLI